VNKPSSAASEAVIQTTLRRSDLPLSQTALLCVEHRLVFRIDGGYYSVEHRFSSQLGVQRDVIILRGLAFVFARSRSGRLALQVQDLERLIAHDRVDLGLDESQIERLSRFRVLTSRAPARLPAEDVSELSK
jgi:hypothetical protein